MSEIISEADEPENVSVVFDYLREELPGGEVQPLVGPGSRDVWRFTILLAPKGRYALEVTDECFDLSKEELKLHLHQHRAADSMRISSLSTATLTTTGIARNT